MAESKSPLFGIAPSRTACWCIRTAINRSTAKG
jgi:hypothetical protein